MDLDPSNYSVDEMILLLGLDVVTEESIRIAVEREIAKRPDRADIVSFFKGIQTTLLASLQKNVNPDTKNIITRILHIDSSHLPYYAEAVSTDKFTFKLSDQINNVLSLTLISIELPQSWYTFSAAKGTTSFVYVIETTTIITGNTTVLGPEQTTTVTVDNYSLTIPDGNYTVSSLLNVIKSEIHSNAADHPNDDSFNYSVNKQTGKVTFTSTKSFKFIWHDLSGSIPSLNTTYTNYNLGTLLGFTSILSESVEGASIHSLTTNNPIHVSGTRYVMLEVNDFSSNRISNNIVLMNALPRNKVQILESVRADAPQIRTGPNTTAALPSKYVTTNQLFNINAILETPLVGRQLIARQASNLFAKIPVKRTIYPTYNATEGDDDVTEFGYTKHLAEFAGSIQSNTREYFGPITLRSMEVSLYDDRGLPLGLNGIHWSCSIMVKSVYQKKV
jgi:hypothetical protein